MLRMNLSTRLGAACTRSIDFLFPEKCALCHCITNLGFCGKCQILLPWTHCPCEICGTALNSPGICGRCQSQPPNYINAMIPFRYDSPVSQCIQELKYNSQLVNAVALAKMLSLWAIKNAGAIPQMIIPMPLHRKKICQRGFNQASEIARFAGRMLNIPVCNDILKRIKNTATQTGLSEKMRIENMKHAFSAKPNQTVTHVALLDDVVTSGSTVNSAARALKRSGIEKISVWAIAKT